MFTKMIVTHVPTGTEWHSEKENVEREKIDDVQQQFAQIVNGIGEEKVNYLEFFDEAGSKIFLPIEILKHCSFCITKSMT